MYPNLKCYLLINKYPLPKQGDCSEDEVDPDQESSLPDQPTSAQVLHIDTSEADRLTGSLMNDFCREVVQVCINLKFRSFTPSGSPSPSEKL